MRVDLLPEARDDLVAGFRFYERQARGLGGYFLRSLFADIDLLSIHGGVHAKVFGYHRRLSRRFPFAIYYRVEADAVGVGPFWIAVENLRGLKQGLAAPK